MEIYNVDNTCPKCGNDMIATNYDPGLYSIKDKGTIRRKCQRCGYTWHEKPLDTVEETDE